MKLKELLENDYLMNNVYRIIIKDGHYPLSIYKKDLDLNDIYENWYSEDLEIVDYEFKEEDSVSHNLILCINVDNSKYWSEIYD